MRGPVEGVAPSYRTSAARHSTSRERAGRRILTMWPSPPHIATPRPPPRPRSPSGCSRSGTLRPTRALRLTLRSPCGPMAAPRSRSSRSPESRQCSPSWGRARRRSNQALSPACASWGCGCGPTQRRSYSRCPRARCATIRGRHHRRSPRDSRALSPPFRPMGPATRRWPPSIGGCTVSGTRSSPPIRGFVVPSTRWRPHAARRRSRRWPGPPGRAFASCNVSFPRRPDSRSRSMLVSGDYARHSRSACPTTRPLVANRRRARLRRSRPPHARVRRPRRVASD